MEDEYAGIVGRIRFFWRFRCVKLRLFMELVGLTSIFAFGIVLMLTTIVQWYDLDHMMWFRWNRYGEAYFEYFWALVALPCSLYYLVKALGRLGERWWG